MSATPRTDAECEQALDQLFLSAFDTDHPAMHDWVRVKFRLKKLESDLAELQQRLIERTRAYEAKDAAQLARIRELEKSDEWQPIETAPRDGTWILLAGPSGYVTTPLRVEVCRYYPEYRPLNPWQNHSNDAFSDGGAEPTHWKPLPKPPTTDAK